MLYLRCVANAGDARAKQRAAATADDPRGRRDAAATTDDSRQRTIPLRQRTIRARFGRCDNGRFIGSADPTRAQAVLSTSKSMYASGQPALYMADKNSLPFLVDHYQRVATGPTSVFVHDLPYYRDTLDDEYMPSVYEKLQKPMLKFIDERKAAWGCDYLARPDGPPFITLDVRDKLAALGLSNKGFRELSLRLGCPLLCDTGVLRIALTGFDKSKHDEVLPHILERLDMLMSLQADDELIVAFKQYNPYYRKDGKAAKTIMG